MDHGTRYAAGLKREPKSYIFRPGPQQCLRNCTTCIKKGIQEATADFEDIIKLRSFDNLVKRKSLWFFQYQSLQYHTGQLDLVGRSLKNSKLATTYIVSVTRAEDLKFLAMVLEYNQLSIPQEINSKTSSDDLRLCLETKRPIVLPFRMRSCVSDTMQTLVFGSRACLTAHQLKDMLQLFIDLLVKNQDLDINIVPVSITKDHDRMSLFGLGSVAVQMSEPFTLSAYLHDLQTSQKSTHLVQHIYCDAAKGALILPSNIVAFLILNLEREHGVEISVLVDYMNWFRKVASNLDMHFGFTGSSEQAVKFALTILNDFVLLNLDKYYLARDIDSLTVYANLVTPIIAYHGLIGRAIIIEYNRNKEIELQLSSMIPEKEIRALRDDVIESAIVLADTFEQKFPCRKPCTTIQVCVETTLDKMATSHYLKIEEPKRGFVRRGLRVLGDWDEDADEEEYFRKNQDNPDFKSWISVSNRDYRRDRLNLFINATEIYFS